MDAEGPDLLAHIDAFNRGASSANLQQTSCMNEIKKTVNKLKDLSKSAKGQIIEGSITDLTSTVALLGLSSPSIEQYKTLSGCLRESLQILYAEHLQPTLNYAVAVLKFLHTEKIVPLLQNGDHVRANLWESPASSVVSGILDYLELHRTKIARETVSSAVYPTICAFYFADGPNLLSSYDGNVLSNVYILLGETVESPGRDVSNLRDLISSRRLGHTIAEIRNYFALESIINLLGNLIPPQRSGKEKRAKFLREVFEESKFKGCKRILQALETVKRDWTVTATKIIHLLAESDSQFPQPFHISRLMVESTLMKTSDPLFVDNRGLVASLDQGGSVDSLVIPFTTVRGVTISALSDSGMQVEVLTNKAPLRGNSPMSLPDRETYSVSFSILKASLNNFGKIMRERKLKIEHPAHRKLSQTPGELMPEFWTTGDDKNWEEKAAKLTNMAKNGGDPVVQDSSSPRLGHPLLSNVDDYQGDSPLVNAIPSTVFVDADGNFSIHPPRPTTLGHEKYDGISDQFLAQKGSQDFSVNDELPSRPTRSSKFKKQTIVISDDEDEKEELPIPKVVASSHTVNKKPDAEQLSKPLKTNESAQQTKNPTGGDDSRGSNAKHNTEVKSSRAKKRPLQDDDTDIGVPDAKRVRQDLDSVPPSPLPVPKRVSTRQSRKNELSHTNAKGRGFGAEFDEIPQAKQDGQHKQAKAMKKKDGQVVPPRPVTRKQNKQKDNVKKTVQRKQSVKVEDADNTLVEQSQLKTDEAQIPTGSDNLRSKKSIKAPWEMQDFPSMKIEEVEVSFDPIDDLPAKLLSNINDTEHDDPQHNESISGNEFIELVKSETTSSELTPSPPAPAKSGQIWIDLTNSPEQVEMAISTPRHAVRKLASLDTQKVEVAPIRRHQASYAGNFGNIRKTVEKVSLLPVSRNEAESVPSTPRARYARSPKVRKFISPVNVRRLPVSSGEHDNPPQETDRTARRHLNERPRTIPKEQKRVPLGSNRRPHGSEDDPDERIAAVLCEITKVLTGNIQKRFTGISNSLRRTRRELKAQVAGELGKMNNEVFTRYNGLVDLHEAYVFRTSKLTQALEAFEKAAADSAQSYRDMLKDFRQSSLRNKLPMNLVKASTLAELKKHSKVRIEI